MAVFDTFEDSCIIRYAGPSHVLHDPASQQICWTNASEEITGRAVVLTPECVDKKYLTKDVKRKICKSDQPPPPDKALLLSNGAVVYCHKSVTINAKTYRCPRYPFKIIGAKGDASKKSKQPRQGLPTGQGSEVIAQPGRTTTFRSGNLEFKFGPLERTWTGYANEDRIPPKKSKKNWIEYITGLIIPYFLIALVVLLVVIVAFIVWVTRRIKRRRRIRSSIRAKSSSSATSASAASYSSASAPSQENVPQSPPNKPPQSPPGQPPV